MQQRRTALSTGDVEAMGASQAPEFGVENGGYEGDRDPILRYTRGIKILPSLGVSVCVGLLAFLFGGDLRPLVLVLTICAGGFLTAVYLGRWVLNKPLGSFEMRRVADPIRQGAEGFLRVQYGAIARLAVVVAFLIFSSYMLRPANVHTTPVERLGALTLGTLNTVAFALGAACSAAAGYVSMWVTAQTNIRVANAARNSFAEALQICFRGGAFSALLVLTMCLVGISSLYLAVYVLFVQSGAISVAEIPLLVVGYGFGASFVALFMQLGGGIYTKAADVGADLVGKVEAGIPEDDPRNPAVIADLVGDMVGDCVGSSADLFESIAAEIIGAMILGGVLASEADVDVHAPSFVFFPVVVHAFDVVVSTIGVFSVRDNGVEGTAVEAEGNPMGPLKGGYIVSCVLAAVGFLLSTWWLLDSPSAPWAWLHFFGCGVVGMLTAYAFVLSTQYFTDYAYYPVQDIAHASVTGHATNIITGFSWGMKSTVWPTLVVSVAVIAAYWLGRTSGIGGGHNAGLLGTAVATMGMLSSAAFILAMNNFGPIADNAGGIVEMSRQPDSVRAVTDRLDAAGNVTKAITKGYSIGSAALACFLLFGAIMDEFSAMSGIPFTHVDIAVPEVLIGGLLGIMLIFLFTGLAVAAVGRTAGKVVQEVRRQFRERPGIMEWREPPDYRACVSIVTQAALGEMRVPGLLAVGMPVAVGLVFRVVGAFTGRPLLGAEVLAAFLMFATVCGVLMALFLDNVGGAWDNAKKYVELGHCGGKGSEAHKAAVTGDTVGDPFKDTAGPALHVVIKLLSTTILVLGPLFISQ